MFSCSQLQEFVVDKLKNSSNSAEDDEIINKVVAEGLRLKKKCKLLSRQLGETEHLYHEEKIHLNGIIKQLETDLDSKLSQVQTTHMMDMTALRGSVHIKKLF